MQRVPALTLKATAAAALLPSVCMQDLGGPSAEGSCTDPTKVLDYMVDKLTESMKDMEYDV